MVRIEPLMKQNFLEYASYVIIDRAIPDIRDGLKPVQRRILHTLFQMQDGKLNKVANVVGETMKLHPHGEVSISDALVNLANKDYFIDKQGNFGNPLTGHRAAASRYIECRLTPLAIETMFSPHLTELRPSYDGRRDEPVYLPVKLPVVLFLGPEGIAVSRASLGSEPQRHCVTTPAHDVSPWRSCARKGRPRQGARSSSMAGARAAPSSGLDFLVDLT